ncbi:MAG: response regulator transcription factor [Dehalococcoidia bacterium]|nr:response regulator transcription factor [Dehalococcoidia bacterium]MDD5493106.1 response regulator transcription factor [Dehalococcoidia bacterium]
MDVIKIVIVDDHPVVREGISSMLKKEPDFKIVGEASNGLEAVEKVRELAPDVVLMDLRMPDLDGVEAMIRIKAENSDVKFIILTTFSDDEYIFRGIAAGARAYLLKDAPREELFKAIRAVSRGESLIQPVVASKVLDRLFELSKKTPASETLSDREIEVLQLMAKGVSNKDIADQLSITQSTVKTHITSIFQKLDVTTRTEAVTNALKKGIIKL